MYISLLINKAFLGKPVDNVGDMCIKDKFFRSLIVELKCFL